MENIEFAVKGNKLTITLDLDHRGEDLRQRPFNPGKTIRVASTLGNVKVDGTDVFVGLNAYVKP